MRTSYFCILVLISSSVVVKAQNTAWPSPTSNTSVGIGTTTPVSNAKLDIQGGGVNIGTSNLAADASLHIKTSYGGFDRLTQIVPSLANKPALNLMGSTNSDPNNVNWWSWGILPSGSWAFQPDVQFNGNAGMFIRRNGNVGIGIATPNASLSLDNKITAQKFLLFDNNDNGRIGFGIQPFEFRMFTASDSHISFGTVSLSDGTTWSEKVRIDNNGNMSIGTSDSRGYKLAVAGSVIATEVKVQLQGQWPDYVFKRDYRLQPLTSVQAYINKNKHLPDMPSEAEVTKKGVNLGEIVKLQTKKIEELTLYLIEQQAKIQKIEKLLNRKCLAKKK